jgi:hypothetical protein
MSSCSRNGTPPVAVRHAATKVSSGDTATHASSGGRDPDNHSLGCKRTGADVGHGAELVRGIVGMVSS